MANESDEPHPNGGDDVNGPVRPENTPSDSSEGVTRESEAVNPGSNDSGNEDSTDPGGQDSESSSGEGYPDSDNAADSASRSPDPLDPSTGFSESQYHQTQDPPPAKRKVAQYTGESEEDDADDEGGGPVKSFLEHLEDLRWTIIKSGSCLVLGMIVCLIAAPKITEILQRPLEKSGIQTKLQLLDPLGGFMITLKLAFYTGLVLAIPFILLFVGQFVVPALKRREKKYFFIAFSIGTLFFVGGIVMCYFLLLPFSLKALVRYNTWLGFGADMWRGEAYFEFASKFMLGVGLLCEIPVLILTLIRLEVIPHALLLKGRRYMFVVNFAICAMLTPVDLVTTFLMALALQLVYEVCILISKYWEGQRRRRAAAENSL